MRRIDDEILNAAVTLTCSVVDNGRMDGEEMHKLFARTYKVVERTVAGEAIEQERQLPPTPKPVASVPVNKSVLPDHIICLSCGQALQSLRRHLSAKHGMSPEEYRAHWQLPHDYPMVAPNYSKRRQEIAAEIGLGHEQPSEA